MSSFLSRTLSNQSQGFGGAPGPSIDLMAPAPAWGGDTQPTQPTSMELDPGMGSEYTAPPVSAPVAVPQSFSALVLQQAAQAPSEFTLEGTRLSQNELDAISSATVRLNNLKTQEQAVVTLLDKIRNTQATAIQESDVPASKQLEAQLNGISSGLQRNIHELFEIVQRVVLDADTLKSARELSQLLQLHLHKVEMFRQELQQTFGVNPPLQPPNVPPVVSLFISEQPLPQVLFKEKPIEEPYVVSILTASQQDITVDRNMTAVLEAGELQVKPGTEMLSDHVMAVDWSLNDKKSTFSSLAVNVSTRMAPISLRFFTTVSRGAFHSQVSTSPCFPFIVITNESQWYEAAGKLLLLDIFGGVKSVPWAQFANTLHSHYLKATRQTAVDRPLFHFEFNYIHQRFFDRAENVTEKQGSNFWAWFGQCMQTIRFKRYIFMLWNTGIIFGFITKEECNRVLTGQGLGTFLIRFSESLPGLFGVAYVSDDPNPNDRIKHCLIKNEDIGSNKSLAEFLRDKDQFQLLLRMDVSRTGHIVRVAKDTALQQFYSKRKVNTSASNPGYIVL